MARKYRLDQFKGSAAEYILYLEGHLTEARRQIAQIKSSPPLIHLPETCPQGSPIPPPDNGAIQTSDATVGEGSVSNTPQDHSTSQQANLLPAHNELKLIPYDTPKIRPRNENPQWRQELKVFLSEIPAEGLWSTKREELHLSTVHMNRLGLVILLGDSRVFGSPVLSPLHYSQSLADVTLRSLNIYAHKSKTCRQLAKSATKLSQFEDLIFVSMCKVILHLEYPITVVHEAMSACFGPRDAKSIERLLRGASWANRCISLLFDKGWSHRSTELFLRFGRPLTFYARFSDFYKESTILFSDSLTASEYEMSLDEESGWMPYSIPCIIKVLLGHALTLSQICAYLGYSKEYSEASADVPDKYCLLLEPEDKISLQRISPRYADMVEGVKTSTPTSNKRRRLLFDGDGSSSAFDNAEVGNSRVAIDGIPGSTSYTELDYQLTAVYRDNPEAADASSKISRDQSITEDANGVPQFAKSSLPIESPLFDVSLMMEMGFDISQMLELEVDMSTKLQPGYSNIELLTSAES